MISTIWLAFHWCFVVVRKVNNPCILSYTYAHNTISSTPDSKSEPPHAADNFHGRRSSHPRLVQEQRAGQDEHSATAAHQTPATTGFGNFGQGSFFFFLFLDCL